MKERIVLSRNNDDIVFEDFENEIVVINLKNGKYYSLSGSGLIIWELIDKYIDKETLKNLFSGKYSEEAGIEEEIDGFIEELLTENLAITISVNNEEQYIEDQFDKRLEGKYLAPVIEKYTDQQELLKLDPIHEVNDIGWPRIK